MKSVRFGVATFPTEDIQDPGELGRMAQERGFESLFFPEHTHIPAARQTPWPGGDELPGEYSRTYDPFIALSVAASATDRLKVGTGICLIIERDPIITAKEVASLDRLCGGRLLFGIGAGWNREEMQNHGTDPSHRFGLMRERLESMKAIWSEQEASYAGRYVKFERIWCWPKPHQQPHPPVLVGGIGPGVIDRVLAFGDEWMPNRVKDEQLLARIEELGRRVAEVGRPPVPVTVSGLMRDPARIERLEQAGVHRGIFWLPSDGPEAVVAGFDRYAAAVEAYERAGG